MGFCGTFKHSELVGSSPFSSNRKFSWMRVKLYSIRCPLQQDRADRFRATPLFAAAR